MNKYYKVAILAAIALLFIFLSALGIIHVPNFPGGNICSENAGCIIFVPLLILIFLFSLITGLAVSLNKNNTVESGSNITHSVGRWGVIVFFTITMFMILWAVFL